jgi:hypothetical protein
MCRSAPQRPIIRRRLSVLTILAANAATHCAAIVTVASAADVRVATREQLVAALDNAVAGTTILLAPGTYRGELHLKGLRGEPNRPIVLAAADGKQPPVIEGGGGGLQFSSPAHLELRDLVIANTGGNGLNIDDSGNAETPAHHIVLENIFVHDIGPSGNRDGIKLSGVDDFSIRGCRVERWGSDGSAIDMVGCHRGVLRDCRFSEARADSANAVQTKGGSREILIEHCRFENAGGRAINAGGSTGLPFFRPSDATYEAQDITIRQCTFIGGGGAIAFVGVEGALVENNTIQRPQRWVLRVLQETTAERFVPCRGGRVLNNDISFRSDEILEIVNIGPKTSPDTFTFSGNAWRCLDRPNDTRRLVRLPVAESNGSYGGGP